ncbi:MAG: YbhB/YbcL family Raf kinase inhibitor-like protein [Myxococcales bacterium]|nr:YbhB/YbcL family Raf kinase inhibitor-like protein [Myxococcales bacterium]
MQINALAFDHGAPIPERFTDDGIDASPALSWRALPEGTRALALIVDDPDAPRDEPFVHWLAWNIPVEEDNLQEGLPRKGELSSPGGMRQGKNSFSEQNVGYRGPAPPEGHGTHHYHFRLFALDDTLDLPAGADRQALEQAMRSHVLDSCDCVGTYER